MTELTIALTQLKSSRNKEENLELMRKYIIEASEQKAKLVVFPEVFMFYSPEEESVEEKHVKSETLEGSFVTTLRKYAKEYNIGIITGLYEKVNGDLRTYNTVIAINNEGEIIKVYRKTHLYDAFNYAESKKVLPGNNKYEPFELYNFKIGIIVCYEVRFPEIARTLALKGAEALIIPSAWVKGYYKEDHWETLVKARALENTIYVATSNQIGNIFTGYSMLVDPLGFILERANEEEEYMIIGKIYKERIKKVRKVLPLLNQRRRELYEI